jgi:hypothetical protein
MNDYYPFTRDELKQHNPQVFEILEPVWKGDRRFNPPPASRRQQAPRFPGGPTSLSTRKARQP